MTNHITEPTLFLFKSTFSDPNHKDDLFFCPFCIQVEGLIASFPDIRQDLPIRYVDFDKPRPELTNFSGEDSQSCPQLIFPNGDDDYSECFSVEGLNGSTRIDRTKSVLDYLSARYGLPTRHP